MQLKLFNLNIDIEINKYKKLNKMAVEAKKKKSLEKIKEALEIMQNSRYKYSEYRLQKISGLSINTIKKYRNEIEKFRKELNYI